MFFFLQSILRVVSLQQQQQLPLQLLLLPEVRGGIFTSIRHNAKAWEVKLRGKDDDEAAGLLHVVGWVLHTTNMEAQMTS